MERNVNTGTVIGCGGCAYGHATVATDNRDDDFGCEGEVAKDLGNEGGRADDVQGGNTEDPAERT